jgi:hypothetical protein
VDARLMLRDVGGGKSKAEFSYEQDGPRLRTGPYSTPRVIEFRLVSDQIPASFFAYLRRCALIDFRSKDAFDNFEFQLPVELKDLYANTAQRDGQIRGSGVGRIQNSSRSILVGQGDFRIKNPSGAFLDAYSVPSEELHIWQRDILPRLLERLSGLRSKDDARQEFDLHLSTDEQGNTSINNIKLDRSQKYLREIRAKFVDKPERYCIHLLGGC